MSGGGGIDRVGIIGDGEGVVGDKRRYQLIQLKRGLPQHSR
jgi:hypothetical protein